MSDIIDLIRQDHAEIRLRFGRLEEAGPEQRGDLFREIVAELARHEAAEEAIVHPALRKEIGDEACADAILAEERDAEAMMARMEELDPTSAEFLAVCRDLRDDVLLHADHEERDEHPRLRESLDSGRREQMARRFERVKRLSPTRPHPNAPDGRAAQLTLGPVTGVFDRARDAVRHVMTSDGE